MLISKDATYASPALEAFDRIPKADLVDESGMAYPELRRTLSPRYAIVWRDILLGHLVLIATVYGLVAASGLGVVAQCAAAVAGAAVIGYGVAYLMLFFHEAAHFNIASTRRLNDVLANVLLGSFVGQDIRAYRPIHFDHHRYLGTTADTERTYFQPLNASFIFQALTGILSLKVLLGRELAAKAMPQASGKRGMLNRQLAFGLLLNATIVGAAVFSGKWALAAGWVAGIGIAFPFFAAVRQSLEHRDFNARPDINYREVAQGASARVFGDGLIASTLGGAGFNRHLLHHWDPQVPYTRLAQVEAFLRRSQARDAYAGLETTYLQAFGRLFASDSRKHRDVSRA
ncbi:MAG: fatty acid desaturase [Usitatibacter sp.]